MSEKMQVPVKRFLYFLYAYIKILVKVGVSLISSLFTCKEKKTCPLHELQFIR